MTERQALTIGGSLEKALKGEISLDVKSLLKEAWQLTQVTKWVLLQAILVVFAAALVVVLVSTWLSESRGLTMTDPNVQLATNLVLTLLMAPLITGLLMMGINHSVGGVSRLDHLFHFIPKSLYLSVTALVVSLLVELGMMLLIVPGVYLMIATGFALPLIIEKKLTPLKAIWYSIVSVSQLWLQFIALYFFFALLMLLVIASFGIAAIWVLPFYYNVKGVLYRELFGVTVYIQGSGGSNEGESVFKA